ncbi:iron-sulfur cluster assembly scaffold protein [Candidatus Micrarchaeota archaeon]|nr:iron-sulfur cluster assembly scaffold protein [Candidatus Micrarchaeota archaeon]MBU1166682.1 iron-sulfur cluster assembly scaffold protein [Candidatus Micrarchaeota archaeon]MBU1886107.1 iron-sulfur cluster assembly scaffold protein [Candidatus Micrarchaeota archaeon]
MSNEEIYQEFIIELYKNPLNFGTLDNSDYKAEIYNHTCGDLIILFIKVTNGLISDVKFSGKGCAISQASASLFTEYLKGKKVEELKTIKKEDVLKLLKIDLSKNPSRMKCALLPYEALKKAIRSS